MNLKFTGLWLQTDFKKLWAGQASSLFGTQAVFLILPLAAVIVLNATPLQMGIVIAMGGLPALFGVFLGVWVDRRARLPVIVAADVGRGLLLLAVPAAHLLGLLTIELIYAVAFGIGLMTILFQISYRPFLVYIVEPHELVDANSKLELAGSATSAIGPGIGGVLVQAFTAPFALLFGAVAYFTSALLFRWIRVREVPQQQSENEEGGLSALREGLGFFRKNRTLLGLATSQLMLGTFSAVYEAVLLLYLIRELGLNPGITGAIVAAGSIGSFAGAGLATRLTGTVGVGRAMTGGVLLIGIST
ncbi:MAG: MFS transporter, partial [Chloroflexi bacterium]|nr:MFS transporter [Chloroflexota bacterium]